MNLFNGMLGSFAPTMNYGYNQPPYGYPYPWPDPANDSERQQRIYHVEQELYRMRTEYSNATYRYNTMYSQMNSDQQYLYQYQNEAYRTNTELINLDSQVERTHGKLVVVRNKLADSYYKEQWPALQREEWNLEAEYSRLTTQRYNVYWKKNELDAKVVEYTNKVQQANTEYQNLGYQIQQLSYRIQEFERELVRLRGY